jgi:hypothetical protein
MHVTQEDNSKAEHKTAAAHVNDKGAYEDTAFGRRRISRLPKWLAELVRLAAIPILFLYRHLRHSGGA